jgi:hypothetical protein
VDERCDATSSVCLPRIGCGGVTEVGICSGHVRVSCEQGVLVTEKCLPQGKVCRENGMGAACCYVTPGVPCGNTPEWGHCEGDFLFQCKDNMIKLNHCVLDTESSCKRRGLMRFGCFTWFQDGSWGQDG